MSSSNQDPDPVAEAAAREKEATEQAALPYKWRQTIGDVDISVPVPKGSRARDLVVEVKKLRLKVGVKGKEPIIDVGSIHFNPLPSCTHMHLKHSESTTCANSNSPGRPPQSHPSRRVHLDPRRPTIRGTAP